MAEALLCLICIDQLTTNTNGIGDTPNAPAPRKQRAADIPFASTCRELRTAGALFALSFIYTDHEKSFNTAEL